MDNGHFCVHVCNLIDLDKRNFNINIANDKQNSTDKQQRLFSYQRVRLNENICLTESATSCRLLKNVCTSCRRCSKCAGCTQNKERSPPNFERFRTHKCLPTDLIDNRRCYVVCEWCKHSNFDNCLMDVMMKNKSSVVGGSCDGDDARRIAMETDINGSEEGNGRLMTNESVLDHLKGMSLSDRRASVTPRITLTNAEGEPVPKQNGTYQREDEAMMTDDDQCSSPLSPRFLAVPKIEELGPERRPPQMVKTM